MPAILAVLSVGCADIGAPPGGEVDRTGPTLLSVEPPSGAVNVPPGDRVVLHFSESVAAPSTGRSFFISPRPPRDARIKWKNDRVEIIFPDSFSVDQTYIISPSSSIADLRGNRFDSSSAIAFSTGPSIDSGFVAGIVTQNGKPKAGLMAALFETERFNDSTIFDSLYPTYLTQSNAAGRFTFEYLPEKDYRLIVFEDRNKDERFSPFRDLFAVPDRPILPGGPIPLGDLALSVTRQDTAAIEVLSVKYTSEQLLNIRLSRPVSLDLLRVSPSNLLLRPAADTSAFFAARAIRQADEDSTTTLTAAFAVLPEGEYGVDLVYNADLPGLRYDGLKVKIAEDKTPPTVELFHPGQEAQPLADLRLGLVFSEPLDTSAITSETFSLWRDSLTTLSLAATWRDPFHVDFASPDLGEGEQYRMVLTEFDLMDLSGNVLGDSLREYSFQTLNSDSLGSVTGSITVLIEEKKNDPLLLTFSRIDGRQTITTSATGSTFSINLPAGKYLMTAVIDSDRSGALSLGSAVPYRYAETQALYADTISVRARFETAGIELDIR